MKLILLFFFMFLTNCSTVEESHKCSVKIEGDIAVRQCDDGTTELYILGQYQRSNENVWKN
ncbi:MAG: hypothetical protein MOGMAGMI_00337 [Candidatus Omnitrophica bacterium]|nr:hypothetical protein [Candidatus Omnitrophota bacterium]